MSGAEPADADAPSDAGHTWGEPRSDDAGDDAGRDAGATRPEPGAAAVQMAVKILCEATEDRLMDTLEDVRLKARARLAALFAQSVAEGHQAYDPDPVVSGPGAFYDSALIAANLFPEDVVDEALAQVVDSSDSISDTPPEGRPAEEPWFAASSNQYDLFAGTAIQPVAVVQPVAVAKAPVPTVLKVQVTVPAEFQDVIATETYNNDPVLVAPKGGTNPNPLFRYPPVPAHVQFGGAPHPTAAAQQQRQVPVKNLPTTPSAPTTVAPSPPATSTSTTSTSPATGATPGQAAGNTEHRFVREPKATGNKADIPSGVPKAKANPVGIFFQLSGLVLSAMAVAGATADSHTFASLVRVAVSVGAADKLEDLRRAGIKSAAQLSAASRSELRAILGDVVLDRLLQPAGAGAARGPGPRGDLPVVHPYARGSMQRISLEGQAGSFESVDDAFLEDRYARTSRAPIESRWKTWQRLCAARSLDPLPLTQEKIFKVGALLKEGKYRSSAQYFSVAKQRHREAEYAWTDALDLAVQQAVRSISRGLGPARPKRDLFVDRAPSDLDDQLRAAYTRLQVPAEHQFAEPCAVLAMALWFLLRGIEVANVRCTDVHLNRNDRLVRLLPFDLPTGGHVHSAANLFVYRRAAALCALSMVARLAQVVGYCLHNDASEEWMLSQLEDWAEHAFRVAGAQLLARSLVPLPTIQMLGRWGSMAVMRYVQEAVMNQPTVTAAAVASHLSGAPPVRATDTLRDQVRRFVAECIEGHGVYVHNDLGEEAGLDAKVFQLLLDHGITNSGTFFYTFQDPVAVKKLLTPATVGEGVKLTSGTSVKLDDVQFMVALSVVAHMVDEIRVAKAKRDSVLQSASTTSTAAAAVSTSGAKAPKVLPEGYWAEFLADFQSEKIGGIARQFPTHLLSGADEVLARLVHERVTRSHTPLKLGEIVAHRQFTASGQINPFRIKEEPGSRQGVPFAAAYKTVVSQANVAEALARYLPPDSKSKGGKGELKGLPPKPQTETRPVPFTQLRPVALLSFFDGIGVAAQALKSLCVEPSLYFSFETDVACQRCCTSQHSAVEHQGDALAVDPSRLASTLKTRCSPDTVLLVCAAPPCHDFSAIRGASSPGVAGPEGAKFVSWSKWLQQFASVCTLQLVLVVENVLMQPDIQDLFDKELCCKSFVCDAASWSLVSRPRLWWVSNLSPPKANEPTPASVCGGLARWRKYNRFWQLLPASPVFPKQVASTCSTAVFHNEVVAGRVLFPCLTTPAPSPAGRPPPPKRRRSESPGTMARWKEGSQQYPPWQYRQTALVRIAGVDRPPDAATREWIQGLPSGYTAVCSEQERCTQLGNSWHLSVARFLLCVVLVQSQALSVSACAPGSWYPPVPDPTSELRFHPDGSRPLVRAASFWHRSSLTWDPREPGLPTLSGPTDDPFAHLDWAMGLDFLALFPVRLNPCLQWCYEAQPLFNGKLPAWRQAVCDDLSALVEELREEQETWFLSAPQHVRKVYSRGQDTLQVHLLTLTWLLDLLQFPGRRALVTELFWGFPLLGPLTPGTGWAPRSDYKYSRPLSPTEFKAANRAHVQEVVSSLKLGEHSETMFAEILEECQLGRVSGPFPASKLLLEDTSSCASRAFPVVQGGKVRRADDWLRSHHNATVWVSDSPAYCGVDTLASCLQFAPVRHHMLLSAVDHEGAYRGLPVRSPGECGVVLPVQKDRCLFVHNSLPFGSTGSVWSYLRVADVLSFLAVSLLFVPSAHFVDDFHQSESDDVAESGFQSFKLFHSTLGFRMKVAKEKRPSRSHTLLGVLWTIVQEGVWASPGPERVQKLVDALSECLQKGSCSGPLAAKLAGKLTFVCAWVFGKAGQALLKPLYRRQHSGRTGEAELPPALRVSFRLLVELLPALKPRFLPNVARSVSMRVARLYADAFITMHGQHRCANRWMDDATALQQLRTSTNGWGAIYIGPSGKRWSFRAQVPESVLRSCCSSRDYIYWLEAVAQLISLAVVAQDQFDCIVCFVDNTAAEHALNKGTSKNPSLCWLIGAFWVWVARQNLFVSFQRVSSQANLSDKVSRGDFSEAQQLGCQQLEPPFEAAWPPLLRLQQEPANLQAWDFQSVVDVLFVAPPHSEAFSGRAAALLTERLQKHVEQQQDLQLSADVIGDCDVQTGPSVDLLKQQEAANLFRETITGLKMTDAKACGVEHNLSLVMVAMGRPEVNNEDVHGGDDEDDDDDEEEEEALKAAHNEAMAANAAGHREEALKLYEAACSVVMKSFSCSA
ncbi:hypothetical protein AK812_SmicGene18150 [Symbiodinium microadriaticum]|uniref:Uncharacterized protein n=1 Tax=Symbiodinium microadriaticum TaxID=2951 RepID=A0A1Q9DW04_SYMMI|nr:hypothetical protein AK812_SmicGene18150 [Symbiodinium microadriaticum]